MEEGKQHKANRKRLERLEKKTLGQCVTYSKELTSMTPRQCYLPHSTRRLLVSESKGLNNRNTEQVGRETSS